MWEDFSSGYLNFELNCAGVYSKEGSFVNSGWISMKHEIKNLGMPTLLKYPIKSYLKNVTLCEIPLNFL